MNDRASSRQLDLRSRIPGRFLRLVNPLARRLISVGLPTGAPNVLLTTRGRRSGRIRPVPLGLLELDDRRFVQASYGETGWVANLRAGSETTLTYPGGSPIPVEALELTAREGAAILERALEPYRRSRFLGSLLRIVAGPRFRPPVGVFLSLGVRIDDTFDEYLADARHHPLFELRSLTTVDRGGRRSE